MSDSICTSRGTSCTIALCSLVAAALSLACESPPTLIINDEDLASWMSLNNTFTHTEAEEGEDDEFLYRVGLLFQVGEFQGGDPNKEPETEFESITFSLGGNVVQTLEKGDFTWINIVSDFSGFPDPMEPEAAYNLFPGKRDLGECAVVNACVDEGCFCDSPPCSQPHLETIDKRCLRYWLLNSDLKDPLIGIITYWQGREGYELSAAQGAGAGGLHNVYSFAFKDDFTISVYKAEVTGTDDYGRDILGDMNPVQHTVSGELQDMVYTSDEVDLIEINAESVTSPIHGSGQSPPWPYP